MKQMEQKKKGKIGLYLTLVALVLLLILGLVYYIIIGLQSVDLNENHNTGYSKFQSELDAKDAQIKRLEAQTKALQAEQDSVALNLGYIIKPKEELISQCHSLKLGKWNLSKECEGNLTERLKKVLEDKKIVAIEISGIVDTNPYSGNNAELKQEGLASFRAKEAILLARKVAPNVAVFEGLSQQLPSKRGFVVKAYYVATKK